MPQRQAGGPVERLKEGASRLIKPIAEELEERRNTRITPFKEEPFDITVARGINKFNRATGRPPNIGAASVQQYGDRLRTEEVSDAVPRSGDTRGKADMPARAKGGPVVTESAAHHRKEKKLLGQLQAMERKEKPKMASKIGDRKLRDGGPTYPREAQNYLK